jgi:acyl-CoA dehydrogenase
MNLDLTPGQTAIRDAISRVCSEFGDDYWMQHNREGCFPAELHDALARDGWPGIAIPEASPVVARTPPKRDLCDC